MKKEIINSIFKVTYRCSRAPYDLLCAKAEFVHQNGSTCHVWAGSSGDRNNKTSTRGSQQSFDCAHFLSRRQTGSEVQIGPSDLGRGWGRAAEKVAPDSCPNSSNRQNETRRERDWKLEIWKVKEISLWAQLRAQSDREQVAVSPLILQQRLSSVLVFRTTITASPSTVHVPDPGEECRSSSVNS